MTTIEMYVKDKKSTINFDGQTIDCRHKSFDEAMLYIMYSAKAYRTCNFKVNIHVE